MFLLSDSLLKFSVVILNLDRQNNNVELTVHRFSYVLLNHSFDTQIDTNDLTIIEIVFTIKK